MNAFTIYCPWWEFMLKLRLSYCCCFHWAGHSAVLHGCTVEDEAFVGMGATLLDGVIVEKNAMVAAGALVRQNTRIPSGEVCLSVHAVWLLVKVVKIRILLLVWLFAGIITIVELKYYARSRGQAGSIIIMCLFYLFYVILCGIFLGILYRYLDNFWIVIVDSILQDFFFVSLLLCFCCVL